MIDFIRRIADRDLKDSEYKLAQSGDATCNGLDSAEVNFLEWFSFQSHQIVVKLI